MKSITMPRSFSNLFTLLCHQVALLFCFLLLTPPRDISVTAMFPCTKDEECEDLLKKPGAKCHTDAGLCSNPYYIGGGCLQTRLGSSSNWTRGLRVCNSQDAMPESLEKGYCRMSPLDYAEIRIELQNWDSATFIAYLMQILLSEFLDVPTSIESSVYESQGNFYNPTMNKQYGWSTDARALNASSIHGDCIPLTVSPDTYMPCSHVMPESWDAYDYAPPLLKAGIIEQPHPVGELAREGWYIPLQTVRHDGSLLHWAGLVGEENRRKLARTFKRPVSFREYCEEISTTNCTVPDAVATRYPKHSSNWSTTQPYTLQWYEEELWRYFVPNVYTGYFRYTDQNNCTLNPTTCTGHIVNYPCGWDSYVESLTFYLNIALESNGPVLPRHGYAPEQMQDIWRAANATNNHVMMVWYKPEALLFEFDGNFSFQRVTLPRTTQTCIDSRRSELLMCSENQTERIGIDANGACDEPPQALQKVFSTALYKITKGEHIQEALQSPAYDALRALTISDLRMGEIFQILAKWDNPTSRKDFGLRDSVCSWIVANVDVLQGFVPPTHPRVVQESHTQLHTDPLNIASLTVAFIALSSTIVVAAAVYMHRNKRNAIKRAQVNFLFLLLAGLFCVALGSVADSLPTSNGLCVASVWLTNFGYSLELVPLVVKLAALNRLMQAGQRFRRINVKARTLYQASAFIGLLVLVFLAVWTGIDPPLEQGFYTLSDDTTNGETVVYESFECKSDWMYWWVICISWQTILLLAAAVIAFQNRDFREDLVETRTLAMMIYSHLLFVCLRTSSFAIQQSGNIMNPQMAVYMRSLFNSGDVIATLLIYFLPKFLAKDRQDSSHLSASSQYIMGLRNAAAHAATTNSDGDAAGAFRHLPAVVRSPMLRSRELFRRSAASSSNSRSNNRKSSSSSANSKKESSGAQHASGVEDDRGSPAPEVTVDSHPPSPIVEATE